MRNSFALIVLELALLAAGCGVLSAQILLPFFRRWLICKEVVALPAE